MPLRNAGLVRYYTGVVCSALCEWACLFEWLQCLRVSEVARKLEFAVDSAVRYDVRFCFVRNFMERVRGLFSRVREDKELTVVFSYIVA